MKLPAFTFADATLRRLHEALRIILDPLDDVPFLKGAAISVPASAAGLLTIPHKLGRAPTGWLVLSVRIAGGAVVVPGLARRTGERWDATVIQLYCTQAFDALQLWIF